MAWLPFHKFKITRIQKTNVKKKENRGTQSKTIQANNLPKWPS